MVTLCDEAFGRVLGALSECGRADNTLVAFTSDHGEMMGRHGLIGKDDVLLDDLVRIPLAISLPGQAEARECDDLVSLTDVFNTCLEAAGAAQPRRTDGQSLLSHSRGLGTEPAGEIFLEHHGSMFFNAIRGIRTREFKYVFNPHNFDELYDLRLDPLEMTNRVDDTSYSDILRDLRERLVDWMTRTEDQATQGAQYSLLEHP
jgi:arylsulfatase A-like enzyme